MVNRERMLQEFFELVRITSSTGAERELADVLKGRLTGLGFEVTEDDAGSKFGGNCGNIIAFLKGTVPNAPVLLLSAHMDSVEPCAGVEPKLNDGVITASGTTVLGADDKSGIVEIMEAVRVVKENALPHGDIQVVFTVAEENGANGAQNINMEFIKADFGYVLDCSGVPGRITVRTPGKNKIRVVVYGKAAHAGNAPERGINAIMIAGKALADLKDGRIDSETTSNVAYIKGGSVPNETNTVPDQVELTLEVRSRDKEKLTVLTENIVKTFERVAGTNGTRAEVIVNKAYEPYMLSEDNQMVAVAKQAAETIGLIPMLAGSGGGSDANTFNSRAGSVIATTLGTGMNKAHTKEEYIEEAHLYQAAEWIIAITQILAEKRVS